MLLTDAEFERSCMSQCQYCRNGKPLRQRDDTKEWIHDLGKKPYFEQTICRANKMRRVREQENG